MTSQPDGTVFVEINNVLLPDETALEIARLSMTKGPTE